MCHPCRPERTAALVITVHWPLTPQLTLVVSLKAGPATSPEDLTPAVRISTQPPSLNGLWQSSLELHTAMARMPKAHSTNR